MAGLMTSLFSVPLFIPKVFKYAYNFIRACGPLVIAAVAVIGEIFSFVNGYLLTFLNYISETFQSLELPTSRILQSISTILASTSKEIHKRIFKSTPIYFKPVIYFVDVGIEFTYLLIDFISKTFPHQVRIFILLLIWYWPMGQFGMYIEENPLASNDTVQVFYLAFKGIWIFVSSILNVAIFIYDLLLPFIWFGVTSSVYLLTLLVAHVGLALGLIPSLKSLVYFDPIKHIEIIFSNNLEGSKLGDTLNLNSNSKTSTNIGLSTRNLMLWESTHPYINHELARGRSMLSAVIDDNPVFANNLQSDLYAISSFSFGTVQIILVVILSVLEFLFDIFYIWLDYMLFYAATLRIILVTIIPYFGKAVCAFSNFGCAINEIVTDLINKIIESFGLGNPQSGGCSAAELDDVPCQCSLQEGGLFKNRVPCSPALYSCIQETQTNGQVLYKELLDGQSTGLTGNANAKVGCPNSFQSIPRRALSTMCFYSCIVQIKHPLLPMQHHDGWHIQVCGNHKYYLGHCHSDGTSLIQNEDLRKLYDKNEDLGYMYFSKLKTIVPNEHFIYDEVPPPMHGNPSFTPETKESLFTKPFKKIYEELSSISLDQIGLENDVYMKTACLSPPIEDHDLTFSELLFIPIVQQTLCTFRKYTYFYQAHTSKKKKGRSLKDYSISAEDWFNFAGYEEQAGEKQETSNSKTASHFYARPMGKLLRNLLNENLNALQILELFHTDLIDAHKAYLYHLDPDMITLVGFGRGLYTKTALSFLNHAMNQTVHHALSAEDRYKEHFIGPTEMHQKGIFRRFMLSNNEDLGYAVSLCGYRGYLCPDGVTCAINGNPRTCKPCETYSAWCTFRTIPHIINTGFEEINIGLFFSDAVACWRDISANPEKNPLRGLISGKILIWDQNPQFYNKDIRYCPGLTPPLPLIPLLTWDYLKYIGEVCGENNPGASLKKCACPQYTSPAESGNTFTDWLWGLPVAVKARITNCNTAIRYRLVNYIPSFISELWTMLVNFFYVNSQADPELAYALDWKYNQYNLSPENNDFCMGIHTASIYFGLSFFYYPLVIFMLYGRKLAWVPVRIPLDIVYYITAYIFDFFHRINTSYIVERYDSTWKRNVDVEMDLKTTSSPLDVPLLSPPAPEDDGDLTRLSSKDMSHTSTISQRMNASYITERRDSAWKQNNNVEASLTPAHKSRKDVTV